MGDGSFSLAFRASYSHTDPFRRAAGTRWPRYDKGRWCGQPCCSHSSALVRSFQSEDKDLNGLLLNLVSGQSNTLYMTAGASTNAGSIYTSYNSGTHDETLSIFGR